MEGEGFAGAKVNVEAHNLRATSLSVYDHLVRVRLMRLLVPHLVSDQN